MSFSSEVKEELVEQISRARHCQIAELAGIVSQTGELVDMEGGRCLVVPDNCQQAQKKFFTLIGKTNIIKNVGVIISAEDTERVLQMLKMHQTSANSLDLVDGLLLMQPCCKAAFLRGVFLAAGSISDPQKGYHFEIVCQHRAQAEQLQSVMVSLQLEAKIAERKGRYVVYLKEGDQIVDACGHMGAHISLMKLENVRILRQMRGSVNRKVNCETANISKTVSAAVRQVEDIKFIDGHGGIDSLPDNLQEIARVRLENPDTPLKDLGELLTPALGKSGVNHRLRRISAIADKLREEQP